MPPPKPKSPSKKKPLAEPPTDPSPHWLRCEVEGILAESATALCKKIADERVQHAIADASFQLNLSHLYLPALPLTIAGAPWIADIDASHNVLKQDRDVFDTVARLLNLRRLDLSGNALGPSLDHVVQLAALRELNLEANTLTSLPLQLGELLHELEWLSARRNLLSSLPPLHDLSRLEVLDLRENKLQSLPTPMPSALKQLLVSHNCLRELPDLGGCTSLELLHCQSNLLTSLDNTNLDRCTALRDLNVAVNGLASIPGQLLAALQRLRVLVLSNNKLTALPTEISGLRELEVLLLGSNLLLALPDCFAPLQALHELCCDSNPTLEVLPASLAACAALQHASFRGTKIKQIDEDVCSAGWKKLALLDFRPLAVASAKGKAARPGKITCKVTEEFVAAMATGAPPRVCRVLGVGIARPKKKKTK